MSETMTLEETAPVKTAVWGPGGIFRRRVMPQIGWAIIAPLNIARGQREAREGLDAATS